MKCLPNVFTKNEFQVFKNVLTNHGWAKGIKAVRSITNLILQICDPLQLNEYETAPYFIQFSQNLTCDCLLISMFSPNLPELIIKLFWKLFWTSKQNNFMISSGKFGEKHRNQQKITSQVLAELNKIWSCSYSLGCTNFRRSHNNRLRSDRFKIPLGFFFRVISFFFSGRVPLCQRKLLRNIAI